MVLLCRLESPTSLVTDTDHAGYVWIVALLSLIYPFITLLVRLKVR